MTLADKIIPYCEANDRVIFAVLFIVCSVILLYIKYIFSIEPRCLCSDFLLKYIFSIEKLIDFVDEHELYKVKRL